MKDLTLMSNDELLRYKDKISTDALTHFTTQMGFKIL